MKKAILLFIIAILMGPVAGKAIKPGSDDSSGAVRTIKKGKYTLTFECKAPGFDEGVNKKLIETYFKVYPTLARKYNKKSVKTVAFVIDPNYNGVAGTSNGRVIFSAKYMTSHPGDIDIVTHETMHIVQSYGGRSGMPGWLTEGIADYIRYAYGVDNKGAGWSLPKFSEKQSYKNSYRITARFLAWLEISGYKGIVKKLDLAGRNKTYDNGELWKKLTGKTIDELWADYAKNPAIANVN